MYTDYNDHLDERIVADILDSENPRDSFVDLLCECWEETEWQHISDLREDVIKHLEQAYPDDEIDDSEVIDWLGELVCFDIPYKHYFQQDVNVNIMLDTGDMNSDFTRTNIYPAYHGQKGDALNDCSGLVWLTKQQGYAKSEIRKVLYKDEGSENKFLQSIYDELANAASHMNTLTFLVSMTLEEAMQITELVNAQDRNGRIYAPVSSRPNCGYIVLGENTMCGLFDPWSGGGSVMEIALEKPVKIPCKYVYRMQIDNGKSVGGDYTVGDVYGMCGSAWKATLTEINVPKKLKNGVAA
jgi:hypothetical protein